MVDQLNSFAAEVTRVAKEVGTEGKLGGQAEVTGVAGVVEGPDRQRQLHGLEPDHAGARHRQGRDRGRQRRPEQKLVVEAKGEVAALAETINNMTDTLGIFAEQVTTVAREVGIEGKLGGQARVPGVAGTWKDLTDNVNFMASNLTTQVRGIVKVVTAVANGDLSQKLVVRSQGRGRRARRHDQQHDRHARAPSPTRSRTVAREVGIEGKLGGQAKVPGAAGRGAS